jgi:hypothetical protein
MLTSSFSLPVRFLFSEEKAMKRARWVSMGVLLLAVCCGVASHGQAQIGGAAPAQCTANTTIVGPATILRHVPATAEKKILAALEDPVSFTFQDTPLSDVVAFIKDKHALQIVFDGGVLTNAGKDPSSVLITSDLNGVELRSAMNLILAAQELAWLVKDQVMLITTKEAADSTFETRLYDVRDLTTSDRDPNGAPDFDSLIKTIVATCKGNWQESGGGATIHQFCNNGVRAIAVAQTYDGHEQIEALLTELRKLKPQR